MTNPSVGIEIGGTDHVYPSISANYSQKTPLITAVNGMLVYDTDLDKFQGYEAGAWTNLI